MGPKHQYQMKGEEVRYRMDRYHSVLVVTQDQCCTMEEKCKGLADNCEIIELYEEKKFTLSMSCIE